MKHWVYILTTLFSLQSVNAQKTTFKCEKIYDAIKLVDESKFDEGIKILKECEKIDPAEYTYPYEIAYALVQKKEYKTAISQLEKIKNYPTIKPDYYQLLGNTYDYDNNPKKAIVTYDEGLKKFPNSGRLYLEKGVMYEHIEDYNNAIKTYEKGIVAEPNYSSNYYRVANIFLNSENNKFAGFLYGEIFLNLERTTARSQEMSKLLYERYKNAISFESKEKVSINFCEIVIDVNKVSEAKKLPLCMIFGKNFMLAIKQHEFSFENLAEIRNQFVKEYFTYDYKDHPNVLFSYFKKMEDNKVLNAYNHYIFQIGNEQAFVNWQNKNEAEYQKFVDWYTTDGNGLKIDKTNLYIAD